MSCAIFGCPNNEYNTDPTIHYYNFPKHPMIAQQWVEACGWQPDHIDIETAKICSIHFDDHSYTEEIKIIDYMTCYTKFLKYDAIPTLYLPTTSEIIITQAESTGEPLKEEMIVLVPAQPESSSKQFIELQVEDKYRKIKPKEVENNTKQLTSAIKKHESIVKEMKNSLEVLMKTYKEKHAELARVYQEYHSGVKRSYLSAQAQKLLLAKVFSESQIKILSGKKKIYWSDDDMAVGYTIRHLSNKRCYVYLTKKLNFPLPAVSSIKRWMTQKNSTSKKAIRESTDAKKDEDSD